MPKEFSKPSFSALQDFRVRGQIFQFITFAILACFVYYLYSNVSTNLERQNIASGFGFLSFEAGFDIGESIITYFPGDNYSKALLVGILNTLKVALIGNTLAIILGILVGIAGLSKNWPMAKLSRIYIEILRNIPLLLQLFFWYALFTEFFPPVKQAYNPLPHTYLSQRGIFFPLPQSNPLWYWVLASGGIALSISIVLSTWNKRHQETTGKILPVFAISLALLTILPLSTWLIGGAPTALNAPQLQGFNFQGGLYFSPEFLSLLLGLVLYTSAFMAEIVRAGILSVKKGQWEAAQSLGLGRTQTMRLIILPQALRVIIPPTTSQLLNLTKNSSLAIAIGYPDFVSVANTSLNQTGQAVELISLIMLVYLTFSLSTSLFMNWYNKRVALVER